MKFYCISVRSKTALVIFWLLLIVLFVSIEFVNISSAHGNPIITNEDRVNRISSLGYEVFPEPIETKQITIPEKFSDVYEQYNELQQKSGFNLKAYSGVNAAVYKYKIKNSNEEKYVNIIICDGVLIGGDVSSAMLGGEMQPL